MELLKSRQDEKSMDSGYCNLLKEVQQIGCFGSIRYSSGIYDTIKYKHKVDRSPDDIWKSVLKSDRVQWIVTNIARDEKSDKEDVIKEASRILKEMAYKEHLNLVRGFGWAMYHVMNALYKDGVFYNNDTLDSVRKAIEEHSVILMPSHRCYMDFLVLSVLSVHLRLPLPAIASGMDFMMMKGVSFLLRSSGAFFMRRSFGSDRLYWALFTEYVHSVIINGDRTMEFFIEGTRSRSGKSLNPKLGLLSVVAEPYLKAQIYDVIVIPVSISYDRILEESLYAYELLGVPKPKESTSGLFKIGSIFQNNYGSLHVHFAEPISLRKECAAMDRAAHACYPRYMLRLTPQEQNCLSDLAYKIVRIQQKNMVLGLWSLVATILLQAPMGMDLHNLTAAVQWLLDMLRKCDIKVRFRSGNLADVLKTTLFQYNHLVQVDSKNSAYTRVNIKGSSKLYLRSDNSCGNMSVLPDALRDEAAIMLMLGSYRNQLLHVLIRPALFVLAAGKNTSLEKNCEEFQSIFDFLRRMFCKEFIFAPGHATDDFDEGFQFLHDAGTFQVDGSLMHLNARGKKLFQFLKGLVLPFLTCYASVCKYMSEHHQSCEIKELSNQIQLWISRNVGQQQDPTILESLSKDMITNAIHGVNRTGAVDLKKVRVGCLVR